MNGFKKWLEERDARQTDPNQTVDYVAEPSSPYSAHAAYTPSGGGDLTTYTRSARADGTDLFSVLTRILGRVDPHLPRRQVDGKVMTSFSGTPRYTSPEMAKRAFTPVATHEEDSVEDVLNACADHFVWLERPCKALLKSWFKFRGYLHATEEGVNPVVYQVDLMRFKDCEKAFPLVDNAVQKCEDSDKHADLINAWNAFYTAWQKVAPTLKHYLVTFEKNSPRR